MNPETHAIADWVERTAMPLLLAFALGLLAGEYNLGQRVDQARAPVREARLAVAQAEMRLQQWRLACEPLLSLPPQSAPELVPGPMAEATPGAQLRVMPLTAAWGVR